MKSIVRLFTTTFFLISEAASAFGSVRAVPLHSSVISQDSYEDIRIDENHDGLIDFWYLKNKNTTIYISFKSGQAQEISIQKFNITSTTVANYVRVGDRLVLTAGFERPIQKYNGEPVCEEKNEVSSGAADIKKVLSLRQRKDAASAAVSCSDENTKSAISEGLFTLLADKNLTDCFSDKKLVSSLGGSKVDLAFLSEKMKLDFSNIENQAADTKDLIECSMNSKGKLSGNYTENGKIQIKIPSDTKEDEVRNSTKSLLFHELIHRAGVKDENTVDAIVKYCTLGITGEKNVGGISLHKQIVDKSAGESAKTDSVNVAKESQAAKPQASKRSPSSTAVEKGGGGEGVNIAKEVSVAEVQQAIPSSDKLAVNSVNMTDEGKAQAVAASERQSAPVFAMADRAMGVMNTPALASNDRYQSRYNGYESTASKSKSTTSDRDLSKGVYLAGNKNMRVVEEVDLTKGGSTTTASEAPTASAASGNSRMIASTGRAVAASGASSDELAAAGNSGGGSVGASGGGSGTYFATGSGGTTARKAKSASRSGASASGVAANSRDDVLSNFTGADYAVAKNLMKETSFQQKMIEYQITVIDKSGLRWGATTGKTVFSDEGTRFIRVK